MSSHDALSLFELVGRELWIVTAGTDARRAGLVATFVAPASIVPEMPRIVVGVAKTHATLLLIAATDALAVHLIDESQLELVWRFGLQSSRDVDKFDGLATSTAATGSPILTDALGWLDCRVETRLDTGDRVLHLCEVVRAAKNREDPPLTTKGLGMLGPPEKLAELRRQMAHDAAIDRKAIDEWRGRR